MPAKLTAANSPFLRDAKARYNRPTYARVLELTNGPGGHDAAVRFLKTLDRNPPALDRAKAAEPLPGFAASPEAHARVERATEQRLERRVIRAADRWQRKFPCPSRFDDPEAHALWVAVENLLAHDEGRAPGIDGDQTPRSIEGRLRLARELVPAPLDRHNEDGFAWASTTADALTEPVAIETLRKLHDAGIGATRREDCDGLWGLIITLEG